MFSVGAGSVAIYLEGTREPLKVCELESAEPNLHLRKMNLVGTIDWSFLEGTLG